MATAQSRIGYLATLWRAGVWGKWIALVWTIYGIFVAFRDEIVPPVDAEKWRLLNILPNLGAGWWAVIAFIVVALWVFEASFRNDRARQDAIAELSPSNALNVTFDPTDERCVELKRTFHGAVGESYYLLVSNAGSKSLHRIKVIALPGWITSVFVSSAHNNKTERLGVSVQIQTKGVLDPGATDRYLLFYVDYGLAKTGKTFPLTIEVRAMDAKTVQLELQFDPTSPPFLRPA